MDRLRLVNVLTELEYDEASAGTRATYEHNCTDAVGNPITPDAVFFTPRIADADGAISTPIVIHLVEMDNTEMVVRSNVDAVTFDAMFFVANSFGQP